MKKQIMTAFAFSTMMTLAMSFASFAAARSCQTDFRPENNCGYTGTNAVSVIQMQDGCVISNRNAIDLYTLFVPKEQLRPLDSAVQPLLQLFPAAPLGYPFPNSV